MKISPSKGKALDLSGAFLFLVIAIAFGAFGLILFAIAAGLAVIAFGFSWSAWSIYFEDGAAFDSRRHSSLGFAIASAAVFVVAVIAWVLA